MKISHGALVAAVCALAQASAVGVTPVQKVVEMLEDMLVKGKKEKHDEQVQFAASKQFCDDTLGIKQRAVDDAGENEDKLKAGIEVHKEAARTAGSDITKHDENIAVWNGDMKAATSVRAIEHSDYQALHTDYTESVDALRRAVAVLKQQGYDRGQAETFLTQVQSAELIPLQAKQAIDAFLQSGLGAVDDDGLSEGPEADGYEFQSHGVVDMLEKLQDKFIEERTAHEKKEINSRHAADLLVQDLEAQVVQARKDGQSKRELKAKQLQAKAETEGSLEELQATKAADEQYVADLTATCSQKAAEFESRQELRTEEIDAISKAIQVINDGVAGHAQSHLPALLQRPGSGVALVQLRHGAARGVQERAAEFLSSRARSLNSHLLSALALKVSDDPFGKVKKMLNDLITRLLEEANEETTHNNWCNTELGNNEVTRKEKTRSVETLHAEIDQLQASTAKLVAGNVETSKAIADNSQAMLVATNLRQDEKAKNEQTIKDAKDAQTALAEAIRVLQEFYGKAGEVTSLVQAGQDPGTSDGAYQGMQAEHGGVVGMLEVIQSDFARLEADTDASEAASLQEYKNFATDTKADTASQKNTLEHNEGKVQTQKTSLLDQKSDLDGTQKELDAALDYYDKLKPSCVDAGVSYDERVARREEEIQSLQEALRILNGEDFA